MENKIELNNYYEFIDNLCKQKHWKKDWSSGGTYIFLELAEFLESLRGKGDPIDELGDVLFTLFSVVRYYNLDINEAIKQNIKKLKNRFNE